jgi:3-oxoacyl-[acyl-carrier protein] reductase
LLTCLATRPQAIHNTTASLCQALAGSGVTVNAIAAGLIRTPEVERWFYAEAKARGWSDRWDEIEANILESYLPIPVGHIGATDDVARMVAFLASPHAKFVNGAVVRVDGGSHSWAG